MGLTQRTIYSDGSSFLNSVRFERLKYFKCKSLIVSDMTPGSKKRIRGYLMQSYQLPDVTIQRATRKQPKRRIILHKKGTFSIRD